MERHKYFLQKRFSTQLTTQGTAFPLNDVGNERLVLLGKADKREDLIVI